MGKSTTSLYRHKENVPFEFNKVARRYDIATTMSQGYQDDLVRSAGSIGLQGNESVLDLCCGTGRSSEAVREFLPEGKITGVDNSAGMLEVAAQKFAMSLESGKTELHLMDAMHLTFPHDEFDVVFSAYGLRNMPDYDGFVSGVHRVLKPGGKICIHDYCLAEASWVKAYWAVLGYGFILPFCTLMTGQSRIFRYLVKSVLGFLNPSEVTELLRRNGFEEIRIVRQPSWRRPLLHTFIAIKS